jgi:predicted secreted protein
MAEIRVTEGESQVTTAVGDSVVVRLVEPGSTGFQWTTQVEGDAVVEDFSTLHGPDGGDPAPGRAGSRLVGLKAVNPGSADVTFSLRRVWEDVEPVEQLQLHVDVRDALFPA